MLILYAIVKINSEINFTRGVVNFVNVPDDTKTINRIKRYLSYLLAKYEYFAGRNARINLEPSKGGIGTKLKTPKPML